MSIRTKLLLVFLVCGVVPLLALAIFNYVSGRRAIERLLFDEAEASASRMAAEIERQIEDRKTNLVELARQRPLREYVRAQSAASDRNVTLPEEVRAAVGAFFLNYRRYYASITCLDAQRRPLFRVENVLQVGDRTEARFKTEGIEDARADERVWQAADPAPVQSALERENFGAGLRLTLPVFFDTPHAEAPRGALVVELKLNAIFDNAVSEMPRLPFGDQTPARMAFVLDRSGTLIFHTNESFKYQPVARAMPGFAPVLAAIEQQRSGRAIFRHADGDSWVVAFRPTALDLTAAVGINRTRALAQLEDAALASIALSFFIALLAAVALVTIINRTTRRIARVAEGAAAVARGDLDQRIEITTQDETRVLADSFNSMTRQLRELIAREAETRQFESFMRLSAMLTHDLKNAITSLSMLVRNMEKQFHREEFRQDAIASLGEATDKLRRIVARLNAPAETLQSEARWRKAPVDLAALIRRCLRETAAHVAEFHRIETDLPDSIMIMADEEAICKVIENLIINAIEAMGTRSGRLSVQAGWLNSHEVFFSVADTGRGMSEEFIRTKLYRPFATTKEKGIGLGLCMCREIVEGHGGHLEVESKEGVGTRFRVVLPLTSSDESQAH
ncbi:MAG: hypothetical protein C4334_05730 [Pyrinomonas sp.]|uniref:ATP-binding protein n=1 Tax=Pyrinomonas sp. TaxID=2080306 RepID=UPI00331B18C1